jgi:hypothetical protein
MYAYHFEYKPRQSAALTPLRVSEGAKIVVQPTTEPYVEQMNQLQQLIYGYSFDRADEFRSQIQVFPEGQFIALDVDADQVVGYTSSMRLSFNSTLPLLESWATTTGYG